jgi:hypothetical protein
MTPPARCVEIAGQEVDEGRLAGAVRAKHRVQPAVLDTHGDAVHRGEAAEATCQPSRG